MKKNIYLYPDGMENSRKDFQDKGVYFIDSINSLFVPSLNTTYIDVNACQEWANLEGEVVLMTPGMAARTELKRYYPNVNLRARKSDFQLLDISPPAYWLGKPIYAKELYYYDLTAAYHQIYKHLTLDIAFPRGIGEYTLRPIADRLEQWKAARNSLVGITRGHTLTAVKGNKASIIKYHNPYFSPGLWGTIQHVLHDIAHHAVKLGCVYIGTDCYIFNTRRKSDYFREYLITFQMDYHAQSGPGEVTGWGSYQIEGGRKTNRRAVTTTILNNIVGERSATLKWLLKIKKQTS